MPTREQVRALLREGHDYPEAGRRLGIPPGLAYLIATGLPADAGDVPSPEERGRRPGLRTASQDLANPGHENPTSKESVRRWIAGRVQADEQMRAAGKS
ncbi:hypothetical protein B0I33_11551 [Prauserella shujinwangii]|uniref:Uncharacterized protein n=1 Tax=Prauserella shujinwangii TaxID=1453103 RepID=A0A2T0LKR9_9PSEU|nr:hypothetical protein [Prauserella shujinwangii]PRX43433.1 hypothetical protein B0I33_11551 [Prauserella shujinwangii]